MSVELLRVSLDREKARDLYRELRSTRAVGERLGVNNSTVHRALVALGEPRARQGRPRKTGGTMYRDVKPENVTASDALLRSQGDSVRSLKRELAATKTERRALFSVLRELVALPEIAEASTSRAVAARHDARALLEGLELLDEERAERLIERANKNGASS